MNIIFTTGQNFDMGLAELLGALSAKNIHNASGITAKLDKWLIPGTGSVSVSLGDGGAELSHECSILISQSAPIFLRHIFPVNAETTPSEFPTRLPGLATELADAIHGSFSVQTRILDDSDVSKHELTQAVSLAIQELGKCLDVKAPEYAVSIAVCKNRVYLGVSKTADNLSGWAGGMRRFASYDGQISRAEFKLLEAIEEFSIDLSIHRTALDLGAAPGGWTKALLDRGLNVTAVDPAEMVESITRSYAPPRLLHLRGYAEDFLRSCGEFDVIVNDMRMDVHASVRVMQMAAPRIRSGGIMLMSFKLPKNNCRTVIHDGLRVLGENYEITGAKQLFHNRSEITVTGRPRG